MPVACTCTICGAEYFVRPSKKKRTKCCSYRCKQTHSGRLGGAVRGAHVKALSQMKTYTKLGARHTHRVVMEAILGRPLRKGEIVHHKDGNRFNNTPENLEVMTQSEHARLHIQEMLAKRKERHGY